MSCPLSVRPHPGAAAQTFPGWDSNTSGRRSTSFARAGKVATGVRCQVPRPGDGEVPPFGGCGCQDLSLSLGCG